MTTSSYRAHAQLLAAQNRVLLVEEPGMQPHEAFAVAARRVVMSHPIVDCTTYCVVLHEMGHIVGPGGSTLAAPPRDTKELMARMDEEDAAWAWAKSVALEWTEPMEFVRVWARETYRQSLEDHIKATYCKPPARKIGDWK